MCNRRIRRQQGVTIVELIIFMVIVGIAAAGIIQVMNYANRYNTDPVRRRQAMLIAESYMEEVQQAQMTACDPADANAATATHAIRFSTLPPNSGADPALYCDTLVEDFGPEPGNVRPFDNVNDYVGAHYVPGTPVRAFLGPDADGNLVDTDVSGRPLGTDAFGGTLGNVSLRGITTTLTLSLGTGLGPNPIAVNYNNNSPAGLEVLRITVTVTYGPGPNNVITLDGYRTRYAPSVR